MKNNETLHAVSYAEEKYFEAVKILATYPGDVKSRLRVASGPLLFAPITAVPLDFRLEAEWIVDALTQKRRRSPLKKTASSIGLTLHGMHAKTASKIAERIFNLYFHMRIKSRNIRSRGR